MRRRRVRKAKLDVSTYLKGIVTGKSLNSFWAIPDMGVWTNGKVQGSLQHPESSLAELKPSK